MALGVGVFRAEGRTEGVNIAKCHCKVFGVELTGNCKVGAFSEEVLGEIDLSVLGLGEIFKVKSGHAEHLAGTLAVRPGDDGGVNINETLILEKLMNGGGGNTADAENGGKQVRARTQMGYRAQIFNAMALFLQRIFGGGNALNRDLGGFQLKGLLCFGSKLELSLNNQCRAYVLVSDLVVIGENISIENDL